MKNFIHEEAFSRNLGWVTPTELDSLKGKTVAIAGLGGVGGHYCEVLARLGVSQFHIADFDIFEVPNINRQNQSGIRNLGRSKLQVMTEKILDINPNAKITSFADGVTPENIEQFLTGCDLYLDGLDFFVLDLRRIVFGKCREMGIPAITVAPIGMGASALVFTPDSMSFDEYFDFQDQDTDENAIRFLAGLSPRFLQKNSLVDRSFSNIPSRRLPSTPMGVYLAAGVAGTLALKILMGREQVKSAPYVSHFDAYCGRLKISKLRWGNRGWGQKMKLAWLRRILIKSAN